MMLSKLTALVEGDIKPPFSIATTLRSREEHYSIVLYLQKILIKIKPIFQCLFSRKYTYIHTYIYSPTPVGLSSLANEVIALPLTFIASLFIDELRSR